MTVRVSGGGMAQSGATGDAAAEAARRAAEAARRAAEAAARAARQAAEAAKQAQAQATRTALPGGAASRLTEGAKAEQKVVAAEAHARRTQADAQKALLHANATALTAGQPAPYPRASALNTVRDGGDFGAPAKASLFGSAALGTGALPFRSDAGPVSNAAPAAAPQTVTGAATPDAARTNLADAKKAYDDTHQKVTELNQKLNTQLARLGPALTDAQKQQYVQEYRADHPDEYAADEAAARKLSAALHDPKLLEAARNNPDVAKQSVDAAKSLAESPQAKGALRWATLALDPQGPAGAAFQGLQDAINDDVVAPSLSTTAGQLLADNGGDGKAALEQLTELTKKLVTVSKGGFGIKGGIDTIRAALASGDPKPLLKIAENGGKLGTALAGVGAAFGLASAAGDAKRGEWGTFVKDLANTGRGGAQAASNVLRTLGESGRIAAATGEKAAQFLSRLAPALGVAANSVVLAEHFKDFMDDPSVGGGVQAFGDAVAVVGAGLGTVLPGVGQIVEGVGLVVSVLGGLLVGKEKQDALDNESEGLLKKMGLDADVAKALAHGDDQAARLAKDVGLPPEQIQYVAKRFPSVFAAPGLGGATLDALKAVGLKGQDAVNFLEALSKKSPDFAMDLLGVKGMIEGNGTRPTLTDDAWRSFLQSRFPEAFAYARDHAPDVFGKDAESRLQANRDFELNGGGVDFPLTYARLLEKHKDDPAYTSAFIQRMKDNGSLDNFVRFIDYNGLDRDRSGAKAALQAALDTGVLSQAELRSHLDGNAGDAWRSILEK